MKEHALYFGKNEFYEIIRNNGGTWNDSKERPIVCLVKSTEHDKLFWAVPIGNYEHRDREAKDRIQRYIDMDKKYIQSCFYHIGNTNERSIFFISDVIPITDKYIEREYRNRTRKVHEIKNQVLLSSLEYKLRRILSYEQNNPNFFRQHITDIKNYLLNELKQEENSESNQESGQ